MPKYKNRKRQRILALICCLMVFAMCGCGGSGSPGDQGNGDSKNYPDSVSPAAVSGSAVKQENNNVKKMKKGFTVKSCHENSTNLYEASGKEYSTVIIQCRLDGTKIRDLEVEPKGADIVSVRYVDDEWLYYTRWEKKNPGEASLWRAPIRKKDGCDDISFENEEFLLLSKSGIFDNIYVLGQYIYYNESGGGAKASTYCKYDMRKKDWVTFDEGSPEQNPASGAVWIGAVGENMILLCDPELATEGNEGIYVQPASSGGFQKIQKLGGDENEYEELVHYACCQEAFYFVCDTDWGIMEDQKISVKVWRPGMEQASSYVIDKDVMKALEKSEVKIPGKKITLEDDIKECSWSIWLDESQLYILLSDIDVDDKIKVWLACDGTDKYSLKVLDKVPEFLKDEESG